MKRILFIGLTLLLHSCSSGQEKTPEEKVKEIFPNIKQFKWTTSDEFIIAESNCLKLTPDSLPNQNGSITVKFINDHGQKKWYCTYRHFVEPVDVESNVPANILTKIKLKLTELGDKTIGNLGITDHSDLYQIPPLGQKYAVFGVNNQTGDMNRYYFTSSGDFIDWRKQK
ncbi:MAG: hypothetical protein V4635_05965 [Bacteroidota bacterium]